MADPGKGGGGGARTSAFLGAALAGGAWFRGRVSSALFRDAVESTVPSLRLRAGDSSRLERLSLSRLRSRRRGADLSRSREGRRRSLSSLCEPPPPLLEPL